MRIAEARAILAAEFPAELDVTISRWRLAGAHYFTVLSGPQIIASEHNVAKAITEARAWLADGSAAQGEKAVERFHRTIHERFCRAWPTYTSGSPFTRPDATTACNPSSEATL